MIELPKNYEPGEVERCVSAWWEEQGLFRGVPDGGTDADACCVAMTPPNASGPLHMGHALHQVLQDVLVRWQRMNGRHISWVPGTDHGGIETERAVKERLIEEGIDPETLEEKPFVEQVAAWSERQRIAIREQLRGLGISCDWERERFTLDVAYKRTVATMFVRLYDEGLIYRKESVVKVCPQCATALSEEESEPREVDGALYVLRYPLKGGKKKDAVPVATTRLETLPGDTAIAVNPRDERYRHLVGKHLLLPLFGRELMVVEDDSVDPEFGSGVMRVTPAHGQVDFEIARRHGLPVLHAIGGNGVMTETAGPYAGQQVGTFRGNLLDDLRRAGLFAEERPHRHAMSHCCYCQTVVEPCLSSQWFVKMKPMARPAIDALKQGKMRCVPERWNKVLLDRMEAIRDWCISRQIRWGHPMPIYTCGACAHEWAAVEDPVECPSCGVPEPRRESNVLDSWFSAALWPFAALGWPDITPDLHGDSATQTLVTAPDLLFLWVSRAMMAGFACTGEAPFSRVCLPGAVRDEGGKKISRQNENAIDPLAAVHAVGADALRLSLCLGAASGQDLSLTEEGRELAGKFAANLWKVARFMHARGVTPDELADEPNFDVERLTPDDKHLLAKLHETIAGCDDCLQRFRMVEYAKTIRDFLQRRYCDWYVEYARSVFGGGTKSEQAQVRMVMQYVFSNSLRLLHPLMPFLTEALWHDLGYSDHAFSIAQAPWPRMLEEEQLAADWKITPATVNYVDAKQDLISVGRTLRADYDIQSTQPVEFILRPARDRDEARLQADAAAIAALLKARHVTVDSEFSPPRGMPNALSQLGALYMPLEGLVDRDAEIALLRDRDEKVSGQLRRINRKLENMDFLGKAPPHVVEAEKARKKALLARHERLCKMIETLSEGEGT